MIDVPQVSVVMSCYNASKTLAEATDSILKQTFRDFEFIIVDDGSADNTLEILKKYQQDDNRISIIANNHNLGLAASLNVGIKSAKALLIARMDADDIAFPNRLEEQVDFLRQYPNVDILGTGIIQMTQMGEKESSRLLPEHHTDIVKRIFRKPLVFHPTIMARKKIYDNLGMYDPDIRWAEDADLWYRIYDKATFHNLQKPLLYYRVKKQFKLRHAKHNLKVKIKNLRNRGLILRYSPQLVYDGINFCRKMIL